VWRRRQLIAVVLTVAQAACGGPAFTRAGGDGGAATQDGSTGDASGADSAADAGADAGPVGEQCGATMCGAREACCIYSNNGVPSRFECHAVCPAAQGGQQLSSLRCARASDCTGGDVCCVERVASENVSACAPACTQNQAQLCDPGAPTSGCSASSPCSTSNIADWGLPQGMGTCGGVPVP